MQFRCAAGLPARTSAGSLVVGHRLGGHREGSLPRDAILAVAPVSGCDSVTEAILAFTLLLHLNPTCLAWKFRGLRARVQTQLIVS